MSAVLLPILAAVGYLIAAVLHHAHLFSESERAGLMARRMTIAAVAVHLLALVNHSLTLGQCPFAHSGETLSFMAWCVGGLQLFLEFRYGWTAVGSLSLPIAFLGVFAANMWPHAGSAGDPSLRAAWLSPHILAVSLGFAGFAVAFCLAVVYQVETKLLKRKQLRGLFRRLPPLEAIGTAAHGLTAAGFSFLTLGLLSGIIGAMSHWTRGWLLDPKVITSFFAWLVYAAYLTASGVGGWRGRRTTYFLIAGFIVVLVAYFGVNLFAPGRHQF